MSSDPTYYHRFHRHLVGNLSLPEQINIWLSRTAYSFLQLTLFACTNEMLKMRTYALVEKKSFRITGSSHGCYNNIAGNSKMSYIDKSVTNALLLDRYERLEYVAYQPILPNSSAILLSTANTLSFFASNLSFSCLDISLYSCSPSLGAFFTFLASLEEGNTLHSSCTRADADSSLCDSRGDAGAPRDFGRTDGTAVHVDVMRAHS